MTTHLEFPKFCSLFKLLLLLLSWMNPKPNRRNSHKIWLIINSTWQWSRSSKPTNNFWHQVRLNQKTNLFPLSASAQKKSKQKRERERDFCINSFMESFALTTTETLTKAKTRARKHADSVKKTKGTTSDKAPKSVFLSFLTPSGLWYTERVIVTQARCSAPISSNPTHKTKIGIANRWEIIIAHSTWINDYD